MKFLLDSRLVLWWLTEPKRLSKKAQRAIADPDHKTLVSAAPSLWELGIKYKLGRLELPHHFLETLHAEKIFTLSITAQRALAVIDLTPIHQDPFDRILIAPSKM